MFKSARFKLTAWYLGIIMLVSLSFSGIIYFSVSQQLERGFQQAQARLRAEQMGIVLPPRWGSLENLPPALSRNILAYLYSEDLRAAQAELLLRLAFVNLGIFFFAGSAGYFLAGKTLGPIAEVIIQQERFIADASHELKTPLTALKTSLQVALRSQKLTPNQAREILSENLEEVDSLQNLAEKLLKVSYYQGRPQLIIKKIALKPLVSQVIKKLTPLANKKQLKITTQIPAISFSAQKEGLAEVLTILLDNAIKYSPPKSEIYLLAETSKNNLQIKVKDHGPGIKKADLPHIFDRFYRASTSRQNGFGLGLSLAKEIINLHHGSLKVSTQSQKGTVFTVSLPLRA